MTPAVEKQTAQRLAQKGRPPTAIILGTGLGIMEEALVVETAIAYADIPGFPRSTVTSHAGRLIFGTLGDHPVVAMSGRFHLYEGYTPQEITFPIRVFARMGVKRLFVSCAAGGLRPDLIPGAPMLITDHINLSGANPLTGPANDLGPRFPDMSHPYAPPLVDAARRAAQSLGIELKEGIYVQVPGPAMETAAETRMLQRLGADAVGMSTVIEVIQAVQCGLDVLAIAAITNSNDPAHYRCAPVEDVIAMANIAGPALARIFKSVTQGLN